MTRRAIVYRSCGDPQFAGAIIDGMTRAEARQHSSDAVRRVAMMRHTPEEWAEMTEDARICYGGRSYTPGWVTALLVGYGLICWIVAGLWHALEDAVMH